MLITANPDELGSVRGCVLVPTMGALHRGHAALIEQAREIGRERSRPVVVSIFANPTQFAPHEDFDRYPRTLEADLSLCESLEVDGVFHPSIETVYPDGPESPLPAGLVIPDVALAPGLEEHTRPRFFPGVCRVVHRLFQLVEPADAVFGEKDYQQLLTIRAMTEAMNLGVEIHAGATQREADGLALSSRNVYLSAAQRSRALGLSAAIRAAQGAASPSDAQERMVEQLEKHEVAIDYAEVRDAQTLMRIDSFEGPARALVAGWVDQVRLIDNGAVGA